MPFSRPTLSDLRSRVAADITSGLPTADGLLRFSNVSILGKALAGLDHLNYGYLDWIAKQGVPYTASGEFLQAWAALKNVYQKDASQASMVVTLPASARAIIDEGTQIVRGDSATFTTQATVTAGSGGSIAVTVTADIAGSAGNTPVDSLMTLGASIPGVQSSGAVTAVITDGFDQETEDSLFARMLAAYQSTPNGGSQNDYVAWALAVPGVTRAWCSPNSFGTGTVVVYVMFDGANSANQGFPQGTNGVSANDNRVTSGNLASGDQLAVANSIFVEQPVTAMTYVCSPLANPIPFTLTGLTGASTATRAAIALAIAEVLTEQGAPLTDGSAVDLSDVGSAISAIAGTKGFVITSPVANIPNTLGHLPTLGPVMYA